MRPASIQLGFHDRVDPVCLLERAGVLGRALDGRVQPHGAGVVGEGGHHRGHVVHVPAKFRRPEFRTHVLAGRNGDGLQLVGRGRRAVVNRAAVCPGSPVPHLELIVVDRGLDRRDGEGEGEEDTDQQLELEHFV